MLTAHAFGSDTVSATGGGLKVSMLAALLSLAATLLGSAIAECLDVATALEILPPFSEAYA